jgi:hypothetical protein
VYTEPLQLLLCILGLALALSPATAIGVNAQPGWYDDVLAFTALYCPILPCTAPQLKQSLEDYLDKCAFDLKRRKPIKKRLQVMTTGVGPDRL